MSGIRQEDLDDCKNLIEKATYLAGRVSGLDLVVVLVELIESADEEMVELKDSKTNLRKHIEGQKLIIKLKDKEIAELKANNDRLRENLKSIIDNEEAECSFDHNLDCQEHTCFRGDGTCYTSDDKRLFEETAHTL